MKKKIEKILNHEQKSFNNMHKESWHIVSSKLKPIQLEILIHMMEIQHEEVQKWRKTQMKGKIPNHEHVLDRGKKNT